MEDFKERFINLIVDKLNVDSSKISHDTKFMDDLGADSLDMVELLMEFEREFKITIPDEDSEKIKTVGEAELFLQNALQIK